MNSINKSVLSTSLILVFLFLFISTSIAQDEEKEMKPVRSTFESAWLLDNQTILVPIKGTFEFDIQHRFGVWKNGYDDLFGLYAPSNIRMGFTYTIIDDLGVGFGFTKSNLTWDFNAKYAILKQMQSGGSPVSVTYFGNIAIDTRDKDNFLNGTDRYSFFHQVLIARKVTSDFSVQLAPSISHFNAVEAFINSEAEIEPIMKNDHIAISLAGRYKISGPVAIIANYDQPITEHTSNNPYPNLSMGVEITSSSHAFQIFVGNYSFLTPQRNNVFNQNDFEDNQFLIGFNITRLWNF